MNLHSVLILLLLLLQNVCSYSYAPTQSQLQSEMKPPPMKKISTKSKKARAKTDKTSLETLMVANPVVYDVLSTFPEVVLKIPSTYFPDVEYPSTIMESGQPFYFKTRSYDSVLGPFSDDVKESYKFAVSGQKKSKTVTSPTIVNLDSIRLEEDFFDENESERNYMDGSEENYENSTKKDYRKVISEPFINVPTLFVNAKSEVNLVPKEIDTRNAKVIVTEEGLDLKEFPANTEYFVIKSFYPPSHKIAYEESIF